MDLFARHRPMLDSLGNDVEIAWRKRDGPIPQLDVEHAFQHEEEIVGIVMLVPVVFAFDLGDHDVRRVEKRHRPG
jgi:hypothetical protein